MERLKKYETQRIVYAMPCTKGEGEKAQIVLFCDEAEKDKAGYLVKDDDGRTIWMEKEEFESKFRLVEEKEFDNYNYD